MRATVSILSVCLSVCLSVFFFFPSTFCPLATLIAGVSMGRIMSDQFAELPSRSEYPDYYAKIQAPIDLNTIRVSLWWCWRACWCVVVCVRVYPFPLRTLFSHTRCMTGAGGGAQIQVPGGPAGGRGAHA